MSIDNPFAYETLAFDKGSVRSVDENGFLHVKISPLTRVQVAPYYGKEIPGWRSLGLDPDKIYKGYRPESELKKATTIESINGIPIQLRHHPDFAEDPAKDTRIGATGTDGKYASPYLMNSLHFFDKKARDLIESEALRELSLAYRYKPDFTPGKTEDGQEYDFIMRDISGNHLALVEQGRAGHEVLVYDSKRSDMDREEIANLVQDALDKKLSGILGAFTKLAERVDKYVEKNTEPETEAEKVEETEEVISDKCAADKCGTKAKKPVKDEALTDEEGEEVEEILDFSDKKEKIEDKSKKQPVKKSEKVETEAEEEIIEDEEDEEIEAEETEKVEKKVKDEEKPEKKGDKMTEFMRACGIDSDAPEEIREAFISGFKAGIEGQKEMASDEAPVDLEQIYEDARNSVLDEIQAIDECKSILGNVKVGAFDSANDIYVEACKRLEIACDSDNARDVYNAYAKASQNLQKGANGQHNNVSNRSANVLNDIFNNVNVD